MLVQRIRQTGCFMATTYLPFILFTVFTNAAAQIMLKIGVLRLNGFSGLSENLIFKVLQIVFQPYVFLGMCLFVVSMASHLYVLSKVDLSFAYPFLSLAYVVVLVFAYLVFHEDLNASRLTGIALICIGTFFVAQSGTASPPHDNTPKIQQDFIKEAAE